MTEAIILERFWDKVQKLETGCWQWLGCKTEGYGRFNNKGTLVRVHRFAFELLRGVIPIGMTLDHLCRNRACINPDHLEILPKRENVLRGIGITAIHSRATHCPQSHPYDLFNTYHTPSGRRDCKICRREANKRWITKQNRN